MKCKMPSLVEVGSTMQKALQMLYKNDSYLVDHSVHERSLTHKLAEYLQVLLPEWNVDCEYNRNIIEHNGHREDVIKRIGSEKWGDLLKKNIIKCDGNCSTCKILVEEKRCRVFPDIIVHLRGTKSNLIVIEAKLKSEDKNEVLDKLRAFKDCGMFEYKYSIFVALEKTGYCFEFVE